MSIFLLLFSALLLSFSFFFFNDTATTEIYTLSLHDALPISRVAAAELPDSADCVMNLRAVSCHRGLASPSVDGTPLDRKSTRLNSSHLVISYAVFCLKKKKKKKKTVTLICIDIIDVSTYEVY